MTSAERPLFLFFPTSFPQNLRLLAPFFVHCDQKGKQQVLGKRSLRKKIIKRAVISIKNRRGFVDTHKQTNNGTAFIG